MRVIAGKARSLPLKTASGLRTRPTQDKIKETLFNILAPQIPGCVFLDLFSGSGSIGIEALSRGAAQCVFVENDREAVKCIEENLKFTKLTKNADLIPSNVLSAVNRLSFEGMRFDIVYIDPPYYENLERRTLEALVSSSLIDNDSLIIIETYLKNELVSAERLGYSIIREKKYKANKHCFLKLNE